MTDTVYVVVKDNGSKNEILCGFVEENQAEQYAGVVGGCDVVEITVLDEQSAKPVIDAEAKERASEERADAWLAEH